MSLEALSVSASVLLPVARAIWPHARRLYAERQAGQSHSKVLSDQMNKVLGKTYAHLKGASGADKLWKGILEWVQHEYVAPDFLNKPSLIEWLSVPEVETDLKMLAQNSIMSGVVDWKCEEFERLSAAYSDKTLESSHFARGPIEVVTAILVAGFFSSLDPSAEALAGMVQVSNQESRDNFDQLKELLKNNVRSEVQVDDQLRTNRDEILQGMESLLNKALSERGGPEKDPAEAVINNQLDDYRDLLNDRKPKTALDLMETLKKRCWDAASDSVKFRLFTNIASAYLALGDKTKASEGFLEAEKYAPETEKAACNVAMAYLLLNDDVTARSAAQKAIVNHPDSGRAYSIYVASSISDKTVQSPEEKVPEELLDDDEVAYSLANFYRLKGDVEAARKWSKRAFELDRDQIDVRSNFGTSLLEGIVDNQEISVGEQWGSAQKEELKMATELLLGVWEEVKDSQIVSQHIHIAVNLSTAERLSGNYGKAIEILDEAVRAAPDDLNIMRQKAFVFVEMNDYKKARDVLRDAPLELSLLYAEVLAHDERYEEAMEQVERFLGESDPSHDHMPVAIGLRMRLLRQTEGCDVALNAIPMAVEDFSDVPGIRISAAQVYNACGDLDAALKQARKASDLLTATSPYGERLMVADAIYNLGEFVLAGDLYEGLISSYNNSQSLRRFLSCLLETDQRTRALELVAKLPAEVRELSFYRRIIAALHISAGQFSDARNEIEEYLKIEPNDLHVRLNWIGILVRQKERKTAREYLRGVHDFPDAEPEDRMHLAQIFDTFGFHQQALELAYRVRLEEPMNAQVNLLYIGLFLAGLKGKELKVPLRIEPGTAFFAKDSRGEVVSYFIAEGPDQPDIQNVIASDHPYAVSAIGGKIGDIITIDKNPIQTEDLSIFEIKNKYLHLLHITIEEFPTKFPTNHSFMSVSLAAPNGEGFSLDPIFRSVSERHDYAKETLELYRNQPYPVGAIARMLGSHPLDVWRGMLGESDVRVYCCDGTSPERDAAIKIVNDISDGVVVDPLTMFSICQLGVQEAVKAAVTSLGITQTGIDLIRTYIEEREMFNDKEKGGTLGKDGDKYVMYERTQEDRQKEIDHLEEVASWIEDNCDIIPAVPLQELSPLATDFSKLMHPAFFDSIRAASGSGRPLLCDDQRLRMYGIELCGINGIWSQVAIMKALAKGHMDIPQYSSAIATMIEAGIHFTCVDKTILSQIAEEENWKLSERLIVVLETLSGEKSDLASSTRVGVGFVSEIWQREISLKKKKSLTEGLFGVLIRSGDSKAPSVLRAFLTIPGILEGKRGKPLKRCIEDWAKKHSVSLSNPRMRAFRSFLMRTTSLTS